jgi:hypothetical protein
MMTLYETVVMMMMMEKVSVQAMDRELCKIQPWH